MKLVQIHRDQPYSLGLYELHDSTGKLIATVPVVNSWIQLSLGMTRIPNKVEQYEFMLALNKMISDGTTYFNSWYFLHKPPGFILRFNIQDQVTPPDELINHIVNTLMNWNHSWLGDYYFDSYFEHRELLSAYDLTYVNTLLSLSSSIYLNECISNPENNKQMASIEPWANFLTGFLDHHIGDSWLSWEAIKRFSGMRKKLVGRHRNSEPATPSYSPDALLTEIQQMKFAPLIGFEVSTSLLQCANYFFNQWALDLHTQDLILDMALDILKPDIAIKGSSNE